MNNRKSLILLFAALIIVLAGVGVLFYMQTFKTVKLVFQKDGLQTTVYHKIGEGEKKEVAKPNKTVELKLRAGNYLIVPEGGQYDSSGIDFEVKTDDITIDVKPDYSSEYRESILTTEFPNIREAITAAYPKTIEKFSITRGVIFGEGQWYATTLVQKTAHPSEEPDIYRTVLQKEEGAWVIKAKPALVLSAQEYPSIPKNILKDINSR